MAKKYITEMPTLREAKDTVLIVVGIFESKKEMHILEENTDT